MDKLEKIKELFNNGVYDSAEYDYMYEYDLKQEDKEGIIELYYNLFRFVREIKEIVET